LSLSFLQASSFYSFLTYSETPWILFFPSLPSLPVQPPPPENHFVILLLLAFHFFRPFFPHLYFRFRPVVVVSPLHQNPSDSYTTLVRHLAPFLNVLRFFALPLPCRFKIIFCLAEPPPSISPWAGVPPVSTPPSPFPLNVPPAIPLLSNSCSARVFRGCMRHPPSDPALLSLFFPF